MVATKNKRMSFRNIWLQLGKKSKNNIINGFLDAGYSISTFYSDKEGRTIINEERMALYRKLFKREGVSDEHIWDN